MPAIKKTKHDYNARVGIDKTWNSVNVYIRVIKLIKFCNHINVNKHVIQKKK